MRLGRHAQRAHAAHCAAEFVNLLSSEANELCEKGNKKTVGPEHVLEAMEARACLSCAPSAAPR